MDISAVTALEQANLGQFRLKLGDAADHDHRASTTFARLTGCGGA